MVNSRINFISFMPLFLFIQFSGNPFFTSFFYPKSSLVIYTVFFSLYVFLKSKGIKKNFFLKLIQIISIIWVVVFFQYLIFNQISIPGVLRFNCQLILGFFTLIYYLDKKINILEAYIKLFSFLVLFSIPFFILNQFYFFGIDINHLYSKSLILYTMRDSEPVFYNFIRNSGMFWEPGAFAGYLILAIIFIAIQNRGFNLKNYKKKYRIIFFGVITTLSTGAYLTLFTYLLIESIFNNKSYLIKIFLLFLSIIITFWSYSRLDFLSDKVDNEYSNAMGMTMMDISPTRMGSLIMDAQYIESSPFFGNTLDDKVRFRFHPWIDENIGHGNGMSNFIAYWGIPLFIFWFFSFFNFLNQHLLSYSKSLSLMLIILLTLQLEQFLLFPLYLIFFFINKNMIFNRNN